MAFADNFQRNNKGWIIFPADANVRKKIFPEEVMKHPAKANLMMLQSIIDYLYKPNETILDPMAGTGSIMIAVLSGCKVVCIDCCEGYFELLQRSRQSLLAHKPDAQITVLFGDCRDFLPLPVDHICFSPPYTDILKVTTTWTEAGSYLTGGLTAEEIRRYSSGKGNVGQLSEFFHFQAMEKILALCKQSLPAHGTLTLITKDHIEAGKRVHLTRKYIKTAERVGFRLSEAFKFAPPGTGFVQLYKSRGQPVVEDEDIIILR